MLKFCVRCGLKPTITHRHSYCHFCRELVLEERATRRYANHWRLTPEQRIQARERERERQRNKVKDPKYRTSHYRAVRAALQALHRDGKAFCVRCGEWINPATPMDVGHDDLDGSIIRGPEHRRCNRATAGRRIRNTSRRW